MFDGTPPEGPGGAAGPKRGAVRAAHAWYVFLGLVLAAILAAIVFW